MSILEGVFRGDVQDPKLLVSMHLGTFMTLFQNKNLNLEKNIFGTFSNLVMLASANSSEKPNPTVKSAKTE